MSNCNITINKIYNMYCLNGLKTIKNNSIDMVLTSPPYDDLRNYQNNIIAYWNENVWKEVLRELFRILKENSVAVWIIGDSTKKGTESGTSFKQALICKRNGF